MATNYPTSLDALTNPTSTDNLDSVSVPHATQHANINDAVEALQAKVGVDSSAVTTSHDYKLGFVHVGTNTPEGAVTAGIGSIFLRTNGSTGTTFYIKESGAGNTGWVAVASSASAIADHIADTSDAHDASAISILDSANDFTATDVEGALAELQSDAEAHLADTTAAHAASAISFSPTGSIAASDVQAAIAEVASEAGSTGDVLDYQIVRKGANEAVTSSTTLQNDDALTLAVGASETWHFMAVIFVNTSSSVGDIKFAFDVPAAAGAIRWGGHGHSTAVTAAEGDFKSAYDITDAGSIAFGLPATTAMFILAGTLQNGVNAGSMQLQWAQNTSDGTAITVTENSYIEAKRTV